MKRCWVGLVLWAGAMALQAAETVRVVSPEYLGYIDKAGRGYYADLLFKVYPPPRFKVVIEIVPFQRAQSMVSVGQAEIVPSTNKQPGLRMLLSEQVIDMDVVDAAVLPTKFPAWNGEQSLAKQRVGALIGYRFDEYTQVHMVYDEKSSLGGMLHMLHADRLDVVLDYRVDMQTLISADPGLQGIEIKHAVFRRPLRFGFSPSPRGKELRAWFDAEVQKLKANGELRRMMQRYPRVWPQAYPE
ncbi:substrate-binding periplasmic protein [Rhodoferax aquaticus]|uniref:Transporter substrate-binding domain-containing protein n=1 Tax=Rhodoferax aquaticus TaxID=2527691 RepID=A0A515EP72_9BURK|nr:transporter substrate-binding domain-containing protein [Rhodoferax aquaticus]QDL54463.1 transporter substrate-binding domain-containing protein [Rhodoferax aquaticus]